MDSYTRHPAGAGAADAADTLEQVGRSLLRLLPFPGGPDTLPVLSTIARVGAAAPAGSALDVPAAPAVGQAASLVSQAAAILDEEMARGVLAARGPGTPAAREAGAGSPPVMRQLHELVDNLASLWSAAPRPSASSAPAPAASGADDAGFAELKPLAAVRPGARTSIALTLCNQEERRVHLVPVCTDLIGSGGGRIAASAIQCTPAEIPLDPRATRDVEIAVTVARDVPPGSYAGLLVVRGVSYLRAVLTIEVL